LPIKREEPPKSKLMTGKEWHESFIREFSPWQGFISKEYNDGYADARMKALEAAKKASGIE
jgi:hypothetical protein